jgi:arabinose-5-phosphate isomerase
VHLRPGPIENLKARDGMTRSPKLIGADELAAKALQVMESLAITSLVTVDDAHRPVGIIHMHDILRAKIV